MNFPGATFHCCQTAATNTGAEMDGSSLDAECLKRSVCAQVMGLMAHDLRCHLVALCQGRGWRVLAILGVIAYYLIDIIYKFILIVLYGRLVGHHHVHLPGVQRQVTEHIDPLPGKFHAVSIQAGGQVILLNFDPETVSLKQFATAKS